MSLLQIMGRYDFMLDMEHLVNNENVIYKFQNQPVWIVQSVASSFI